MPCGTDAQGFKHRIGVLPETLALFDSFSIEEHLKLSGEVYELDSTAQEAPTATV